MGLRRGKADVAIRFGPLADSSLTARKLGENGRVIVASRAYRRRRRLNLPPKRPIESSNGGPGRQCGITVSRPKKFRRN